MVSNTLRMKQDELIAALKRLRKERGTTPEYRKIRRELPKDWPL